MGLRPTKIHEDAPPKPIALNPRWYEKAGPPRDALRSRKTHSIRCKKETGL